MIAARQNHRHPVGDAAGHAAVVVAFAGHAVPIHAHRVVRLAAAHLRQRRCRRRTQSPFTAGTENASLAHHAFHRAEERRTDARAHGRPPRTRSLRRRCPAPRAPRHTARRIGASLSGCKQRKRLCASPSKRPRRPRPPGRNRASRSPAIGGDMRADLDSLLPERAAAPRCPGEHQRRGQPARKNARRLAGRSCRGI